MGLFDFLIRLFSPNLLVRLKRRPSDARKTAVPAPSRPAASDGAKTWNRNATLDVKEPPYGFARIGIGTGRYLDLSQDGDEEARSAQFALPLFHTPEQLASWLEMPMGRLAWLVHRFSDNSKPAIEAEAHYHFRWLAKRKAANG